MFTDQQKYIGRRLPPRTKVQGHGKHREIVVIETVFNNETRGAFPKSTETPTTYFDSRHVTGHQCDAISGDANKSANTYSKLQNVYNPDQGLVNYIIKKYQKIWNEAQEMPLRTDDKMATSCTMKSIVRHHLCMKTGSGCDRKFPDCMMTFVFGWKDRHPTTESEIESLTEAQLTSANPLQRICASKRSRWGAASLEQIVRGGATMSQCNVRRLLEEGAGKAIVVDGQCSLQLSVCNERKSGLVWSSSLRTGVLSRCTASPARGSKYCQQRPPPAEEALHGPQLSHHREVVRGSSIVLQYDSGDGAWADAADLPVSSVRRYEVNSLPKKAASTQRPAEECGADVRRGMPGASPRNCC